MAARAAFAAIVLGAGVATPAHAQRLEVGSGAAVRIEIARVEATVDEGIARVEVDETFRNATAQPQEGIWRFQLPEEAVVGSFTMWIEGKERRGRVLDAARARATYDAIVRKKRDPGLLEQVGWREFAVNVFPIPASDVVRVRLVYSHLVRDDLGLQTLEVPLPTGCGAVGDLRVHVAVHASHGLATVDCPRHPDAKLDVGAERADATWSGDGVEPKGPFVLRSVVRRTGFDVALLADRAPGSECGWFVARIVPRLAAPPPIARDLVFVVDRSGSMQGRKIEQARSALLAGLETLRPGDRFDVVSFSSDVTSLGAGRLLELNDENLALARHAAADLTASGGTAIADALATALKLNEGDATRLFSVVFLTDGDPTVGEVDPGRILATFRKDAGTTRLFAFGVGNDVKDFLLTRLAVEGRGDARYVREEENLELPLSALFDRLRTPLLLEPSIDVDGDGIEVSDREPRRLPDLFAGRPLVICGRYRGSGRATFHLRGRAGKETVTVDVPIDLPAETPPRPHVAQIWAKARVDRLLDELRASGPNAELRTEVLNLGLEHQLVTPLTSFLVVEEAKVADGPASQAADEGSAFNHSPIGETGDRSRAQLDPTANVNPDPTASPDPEALSNLPSGATGGTAIGVGSGGHRGSGPSAFSSRRAGGMGLGGGGGAAGSPGVGGGPGSSRRGASMKVNGVPFAAIEWLARHQSPDGRWDAKGFANVCAEAACDGAGEAGHDVEVTGLALLTLLGNGESCVDGSHPESLRNGVRFLRQLEDPDGAIGARDAPDFLRQQAIAALALVELAATSGQSGIAGFDRFAERALRFALAARGPHGAWNGADGSLDVETTGWMLLLAKSAAKAGIPLDPDLFSDVAKAFDALTDPATGRVVAARNGAAPPLQDETATAIGLLARLFAGRSAQDDAAIERGADLLAKVPPAWEPASGRVDYVYWLFGELALEQLGVERLRTWSPAVRAATFDQQRIDAPSDARGSWNPTGARGALLGRVGATALNALIQEVFYRYPRAVGVKFH